MGRVARRRTESPTPRTTSSQGSSRGSSITLGAIPDRGLECGFGPPPWSHGIQAYPHHLENSETDREGTSNTDTVQSTSTGAALSTLPGPSAAGMILEAH